jgi:preprotein translocase subunit SecG
MGKLCTSEVGGVKMKKKGKKTFCSLKKTFFLIAFFLATCLALHFKDDL